jgi:hypothetical protein
MAAGRRGRPYQVPVDDTPLNGPTVDVDARVGWLLLMSRLHHRDPELALGESFNAALRRVGLQADRSAVSRWESGKVTPRYSVLVAYEGALGLRPGQLTSVVNAQRRAFGSGGLASWMPVLDSKSDGFHERLDSLFDGLLEGPGTGPEWTALAHHVSAAGTMYVHGGVWKQLSDKLINQLARSVGVSYLQRFEAVRLLLEHRVAHPWLIRATGEFLDDPAVQIVNDPMGVLEVSEAPEAAQLVLDRFLTTQSTYVLAAAANAVAIKIENRCYGPPQLELVEATLARRIKAPGASVDVFEELITSMPGPARGRLLGASRGMAGHEQAAQSAAHGERVPPEVARRVTRRIADTVRDGMPASNLYDDDKMTPRLIREALFSARSGRAHYASLALLGSPVRIPLAAALAGEIDSCGLEDPLAAMFCRLLRYISGPQQEETLLRWLPKAPDAMACDVALALGHLLSDRPLTEIVPLIKDDGSLRDRALLYGLGMRHSAALHGIALDGDRSSYLRDAALWWMRQGGAIRV